MFYLAWKRLLQELATSHPKTLAKKAFNFISCKVNLGPSDATDTEI